MANSSGPPARWARLPLRFDPDRLHADLLRISGVEWPPHFNRGDYEGEWTGVALRSPGGSPSLIYSASDARPFVDTPLLEHCPYFRHVLSSFECPLKSVRLLRLGPGSRILEHIDRGLEYSAGELRFHVPIATNPETDFVVAGRRLPLNAGEAWYIDFSLPHRIHNRGTTDRIHMVIDGTVNHWAHSLIATSEHPPGEPAAPASDFEAFREIVFGDPELQSRLLAAPPQTQSFFPLVVELGRGLGFSFTATDVEIALRAAKRNWSAITAVS